MASAHWSFNTKASRVLFLGCVCALEEEKESMEWRGRRKERKRSTLMCLAWRKKKGGDSSKKKSRWSNTFYSANLLSLSVKADGGSHVKFDLLFEILSRSVFCVGWLFSLFVSHETFSHVRQHFLCFLAVSQEGDICLDHNVLSKKKGEDK